MKKQIATIIAAAALAGSSAFGQLIYEGFAYSTGNLSGKNGGTGWGAAWTAATGAEYQVATPGLSYGSLTVGGNMSSDTLATHTVSVASRSMGDQSAQFVDGASLWFSFLLQPGATFTNWGMAISSTNTSGTSGGFGLNVNATGFTARAGGTSSATTTFTWTSGTTYLVVGKMEVSTSGNENTSIWVNPTGLGGASPSGGTTATASGNIGTLPGTNAWFAFQGGNQGQLFAIDEIRYGTTFASVTPIPEPTTWALLAGSLTALVIFRRRRSA